VKEIASAAKDAKDAIVTAKNAVGGWKNLLELLIALKVASVISGWTKSIGLFSTKIGPLAARARSARTAALRAELGALARIGVITIGIDLLLNRQSLTKQIKDATGIDVNQSGLGLLNDLAQWASKGRAPFGPGGSGRSTKLDPGAVGTTPGLSAITGTGAGARRRYGPPTRPRVGDHVHMGRHEAGDGLRLLRVRPGRIPTQRHLDPAHVGGAVQ
jgi:hypothetical protein